MRTSALSINADGRMPAMRVANRLMSNKRRVDSFSPAETRVVEEN